MIKSIKLKDIKKEVRKIFNQDYTLYSHSDTRSSITHEFVSTNMSFIDKNDTSKRFDLYYLGEEFGYTTTDYSEPEWSLEKKCFELEDILNGKT